MKIKVATNAHENDSKDNYVEKGFDKFGICVVNITLVDCRIHITEYLSRAGLA